MKYSCFNTLEELSRFYYNNSNCNIIISSSNDKHIFQDYPSEELEKHCLIITYLRPRTTQMIITSTGKIWTRSSSGGIKWTFGPWR